MDSWIPCKLTSDIGGKKPTKIKIKIAWEARIPIWLGFGDYK